MSLSTAEKVKIAKGFIEDAPPGEFNEVYNDVKVLFDDDELLNSECQDAFGKHNKEQFLPVKLDGQLHKVLVTEAGEVEGNKYLDPRSKQKFTFEHLCRVVTNVEPFEVGNAQCESFRGAVDEAMFKYISNHYPKGVTTVYGDMKDESKMCITVCIEGHKYNPNNFWNGRWRSQWSVTFSENETSAFVQGWMKVKVHYYEDGNVQLETSKTVREPINCQSPEELATNFATIVASCENAYQTTISENYGILSDSIFKSLRRQLPVTRSKLDWNKILNYKVGQELGNKA
eukprot:Nk52_evm1s1128 gene=Nk52_evmTU1s1128